MAAILERSIAKAVDALGIEPGVAPSSTVALVRIETDAVDALILGDSSVIVGLRTGDVKVHTDDRLSRLRLPEPAPVGATQPRPGPLSVHVPSMRSRD